MKQVILLFSAVLVIFGCSSNNNGSVTVVPLAPTNLTGAVMSTTQINLSWTDNATNEEGYKIERKTGAGNYAVVGSTSSNMTSFSDLGLTPSTSYTYRVYAYNSAGNSLQYSNELTISTQDSIPSWLTNGLVAYYPFNGNANDESGNGNNGTVNGATLTSDRFGNSNNAYYLQNLSNYITAQINNSQGNNITLSCWFKFPIAYSRSSLYLVSNGPSFPNVTKYLAIDQNDTRDGVGNYCFQFCPNTQTNSAVSFTANSSYVNTWVHIVGTYDGLFSKIYINGALISSLPITGNLGTTSTTWNFSKWDNPTTPTNPSRYLDDIRIYNRVLSASEVAYLAAH